MSQWLLVRPRMIEFVLLAPRYVDGNVQLDASNATCVGKWLLYGIPGQIHRSGQQIPSRWLTTAANVTGTRRMVHNKL